MIVSLITETKDFHWNIFAPIPLKMRKIIKVARIFFFLDGGGRGGFLINISPQVTKGKG